MENDNAISADCPVRVTLFDDFPNSILIHCPEGEELAVPLLRAPFDKGEVRAAFFEIGVDVRVKQEPTAGRWSKATISRLREERAERNQRQKLVEIQMAAENIAIGDDLEKERGALILEKHDVDETLILLKEKLGNVRVAGATRGKYIDPKEYRKLETKVEKAKLRSQEIQLRLGQIKRLIKDRNIELAELEREQSA
jgi:hypothetical protein